MVNIESRRRCQIGDYTQDHTQKKRGRQEEQGKLIQNHNIYIKVRIISLIRTILPCFVVDKGKKRHFLAIFWYLRLGGKKRRIEE